MTRKIFTSFFIAMLLVFASAGAAEREPAPIRVACVGDSITFGAGIRDRATNSYPAQLAAMLGDGYDVRNFGVNGATMLKKGNKPYCRLKPYKAAQEFEPNVVIIKLGTNDTKPGNWQHADELEADYTEMVTTFQGLASKPTVYVCYPVPVVGEQWGISDARVREGVIPVVDKVAKATGATVVDLYEPLKDKPKLLPDKVHPNAEGAKIIAQTLAGVIAPNAPPPPEEEAGNTKGKRQIYLLIGQSNMAGRAPVPDEDAGVIERCFLLNRAGKWEPAKNPLNIYSTIRKGAGMQKMGPGYGFAKAMLAAEPNVTIGLVVNAKGGSSIEQWAKGTKFYDEAVRRTKQAVEAGGELAGVLWHQGESNAKNPEGYLDKLKALVANLRDDLGEPDLPFVVGQVKDVPAINAQLAALPRAVDGTGCANSDGLKTMDRWHFDTASIKLLGQRYADAIVVLQKQKSRD
jgi:acyl-CoA thioesterase-1